MSYCRWASNSDVYVIPSVSGWLECVGCSLNGDKWFRTQSRQKMIEHLWLHKANGDSVPDHPIMVLREEIEERGDHYGPD